MKELQLSSEQEARAMSLHKKAIVADMALTGSFAFPAPVVNGVPYYERAVAGGLTVAAHTMGDSRPDFREALIDVNLHHRLIAQNPDKFLLVTRSDDFHKAKEEGKIGLVLGFQNATPLGNDWLNYLPAFHALGVRVIQLTYNETNLLGSGCQEPVDIGLTGYGRQVVRAMNQLGMLVDLSHVGDRTCMETIEVSQDPVVLSHANPRALNSNSRNKPDEIIKAIAAKGGVIGCVAWAVLASTKEGVYPTVFDYVDHIDYLVNLVGIDHVMVGSDINENLRSLPVKSTFETIYSFMLGVYGNTPGPATTGFASVEEFPNLTRALVKRGYSDSDILKIWSGNAIRVAKQVWDR